METKDILSLAAVVVTSAGVLITWLKHRHDVRVRREDSEPRSAKPFVNVIHTVTRSSFSSDTHALKLEISNREDWPIAVKEVCWRVKSFKVRWPLSFTSSSIPDSNALPRHKIETADLLQLDVDIQNIFEPLMGSRALPFLDSIVAVATIQIGVILTTGEVIPLSTPWTFRSFLAGELIHPSWLAPLVRFYVWARP